MLLLFFHRQVIWQSNHSNVPVQQVIEIPPEFDPDSSEFVSDISDYTTEFKKEEILHIPFEFDLDRADLAPDIEHHSIELQREQMEIPLDFDPDSAELSPDITEYTTKLKQSHERARKLRADLAVEEQREQELSRVLKGIVTTPNFTEAHKRRPRRKSSVERLKVSKHLAEEAMNYFEECVSISTLDSTDFSSLEDPQINSVVNIPQKSRNTSFNKGGSSIAEIHYPTDRHWHNEVSKSMLFHFTEALRFVVLFRNINPSTQQPPSFF
jgi:signal recognition particle subunit SEC65